MDVSKNRGTPKWMVKIMVPNPMNKWKVLGGFPIFLETPILALGECRAKDLLVQKKSAIQNGVSIVKAC